MEVNDALYGLKKLALKDPAVREALLKTRLADNPLKEVAHSAHPTVFRCMRWTLSARVKTPMPLCGGARTEEGRILRCCAAKTIIMRFSFRKLYEG